MSAVTVRCIICHKSSSRAIRETGEFRQCSCGGKVTRTSRFDQRLDTQKKRIESDERKYA